MIMEKNKPKVSVIIPTYNRAYLINRAIQSVLNQTYQDFEIIIVDDGSTDNTKEVIREFQKKDKKIKYIRHEKNKGGNAARNTGIKAAKGEYIAFQDSDDEWLPEKIEKQMKAFENLPPEVGVVYTGFLRIENGKKVYIPWSWVAKKDGNIHQELLKGNFVTTPSIVTRKACFEKAGMFDESLPALQDWELAIRLSKYYAFKCIDKPLVISYYTQDGISDSNAAFTKALELILSKYFNDFAKDKKILSKYYFIFGGNLCLSDNFKYGRTYLVKAVKTHPLKIKFLIVALISFFGQGAYNKAVETYQKVKKVVAKIKKWFQKSQS
jgi:glycosyltransferase involved in cell wall biosynthesis